MRWRSLLGEAEQEQDTPITMKVSARLKIGQRWMCRKSVTPPSRMRSTRFDSAPPASRPTAGGKNGLRAPERAKKTNIHAIAADREQHHDRLLLRELAERDARVLDAAQVEERQQLDDLAAVDACASRATW